ncbi:MAG: translocation/assembly module TamB domain-containing protein [Bryobacterales bacterium]
MQSLVPSQSQSHPDDGDVDDDALDVDVDVDVPVDVDVDVDVSRGVSVDAKVPLIEDTSIPLGSASDVQLDSQVEGELKVDKQDTDTEVTGRLDATGKVQLLGAQFAIQQGTIAFAGNDVTEPNLEFALERDTQTYGKVQARVTGTPSHLEIASLTSDDYQDQSDVMALLLFGKPLSELGSGQSEAGAAVVQDALMNLAGSELASAIGVQLVDQVDYTPGAGLSLGWSIGTDGFLTIQLNPTAQEGENRTEAKVTWLLGRSTQAEVESGDAAVTSAWLQWERRF